MPPKKAPPSLPISAFSPTTPNSHHSSTPRRNTPLITIDAHVAFPLNRSSDHFPQLWNQSVSSLKESLKDLGSPINTEHEKSDPFRGFIYVHPQPLVSSSPSTSSKIHDQQQVGNQFGDKELISLENLDQIKNHLDSIEICPALAEVIWAPLTEGPEKLKKYLNQIRNQFKKDNKRKLIGCTYSIQSPSTVSRTSLINDHLIGSLRLLGDEGLSVEFLVEGNPDRSASNVLEEILECVAKVRDGQSAGKETKFLLCEMGKPEMISSHSLVPSSASYSSILSHLFSLSLFSNLSIKLSGLPLLIAPDLLSHACAYYTQYKRPYQQGRGYAVALQASNEDEPSIQADAIVEENSDRSEGEIAWRELKKRMKFYLEPILEAFGDHRIMYSSDFPAFGTLFGTDENTKVESWQANYYECQFEFYRECLSELGLEDEALDNVFGLNAREWYGL
ncbi:hypothetical protein CROQUDRAFT_668230 [Cronartium quercuum f. sp. fusiforme G11]|uniref:Amidohydrolase-related domain-containing protein n=1 Tax=Cronartium quercuum f. sp. fusiforme G11 TaxID=708437 RepID=A0A9P6TGM3_9BASI|nr:hypothetical protein CROQUDRAFT_668230 [Cronartium quercuum f. sp. fusiforme G11]